MFRKKSFFEEQEPFFEKILQSLRLYQVLREIEKGSSLLDLGSGFKGSLLVRVSPKIKEGVGVDLSVVRKILGKNITLFKASIDKKLKLSSNRFDIVTMTAVIEHVDNPDFVIKEARRVLKRNGKLVITTPEKKSKPVLDFLAKIHLISQREIRDHKRYFDKNSLSTILIRSGFKPNKIFIKKFEAGMNLFAKAIK